MRNYVSRLHLVGIASLALLTVGLALFGWSLRPASGGYSAVPSGLDLSLTAAPPTLNLMESVAPSGEDGAMLTITGTSDLPDVVTEGRWTLLIDHLGSGGPCAPSYATVDYQRVRIERPHLERHATIRIGAAVFHEARITGNGPFFIQLCWTSNGPAALNGAYLSSRIPPLYVDIPGDTAEVTRQLHPGSFDTADYAIQSLRQPTSASPNAWQWAAPAKFEFPQPIAFAAVNSSETQHDSYDAFLSGILFGVAGGALVSLIAELVAPFRSRQERGSREPSV
jgi:hypothetical protein